MAFVVALVVFSVLVEVGLVSGHWVNDYDGDARLQCPGNNLISFLGSVHSNHHEDRKWQLRCKAAPEKIVHCHWTGFLNDYGQPLLFVCPRNQVLNGMFSTHDNTHEDRRFQIRCCKVFQKTTRRCHFTDYINNLDDVMHFNVPGNMYITGVHSYFDHQTKDRRWKLNLCNLV